MKIVFFFLAIGLGAACGDTLSAQTAAPVPDTAVSAVTPVDTSALAPDSTPAAPQKDYTHFRCDSGYTPLLYRPGQAYDRSGGTYIITRRHLERVHAFNLCDVLEGIPGLTIARGSLAGTLSDIKIPGREIFLDDRPVALFVDGLAVRNLNADRVYLNGVSVGDIERIEVDRHAAGFEGGEAAIRIFTRDAYAVSPATRVFWETGPFELNGLRFAFMRSLGRKAGLLVNMEKSYQFEDQGYFGNGDEYYYHPGPIVDIYRAFLDRPDSEYVERGFRFENYSRNWDVKLNSFHVPGFNLCAGYTFVSDFQDDYRLDPANEDAEAILNFASWHREERMSLRFRSLFQGPFTLDGALFSGEQRLRYVNNYLNPASGDSAGFTQGLESRGGEVNARMRYRMLSAHLNAGAELLDVNGRSRRAGIRQEKGEAGLSAEGRGLGLPVRITAACAAKRDSRWGTPAAINTHILLSPSASFETRFPGGIGWDIGYGCDRRYPGLAILYLDNPKLNYTAGAADFKRIKTYSFTTGVNKSLGFADFEYRLSDVFTVNPAFLAVSQTPVGDYQWILSQDSVRYTERTENTFDLGLAFGGISNHTVFSAIHASRRSERYPAPFWTYGLYNALRAGRHFAGRNLYAQLGLYTRFRPEAWAADPYLLEEGKTLTVLGSYLTFDLEIEIRIKTFILFTRLQNLSNQVESHDPGYYLPGPLIRWGIDWRFGD